jgi:glucose-1-phosphate thymidylyltransferase
LATISSGDNIFYGHGLPDMLSRAVARAVGATVFGYRVSDPERYGVVGFDQTGRVTSLEEKPKVAKSNFAVTGLYFYDQQVADIAANLRPSARGELEITDLNRDYLERGLLTVEVMGRGFAWLDTGTPESLLAAADFVASLEKRQGLRIACPEEVAFNQGFIDRNQLEKLGASLGTSDYARYVQTLARTG